MSLAHDSVGLVILWSSITSVVAVDEHQTGEATGVNTVMRNIGSAVGAQVAGTIIATHVLANGLAENAGFTIAFLISAVGAVIAAISVLLIPGHRSRQPAAELRKQASVAARAPA
jgi:predicted MFS family arabinose efflux permease